jgi:hypothetical protein
LNPVLPENPGFLLPGNLIQQPMNYVFSCKDLSGFCDWALIALGGNAPLCNAQQEHSLQRVGVRRK